MKCQGHILYFEILMNSWVIIQIIAGYGQRLLSISGGSYNYNTNARHTGSAKQSSLLEDLLFIQLPEWRLDNMQTENHMYTGTWSMHPGPVQTGTGHQQNGKPGLKDHEPLETSMHYRLKNMIIHLYWLNLSEAPNEPPYI
jgi:hypothetical protein